MKKAWSTSNRRSRLPGNWSSLRNRVFKEKGRQCYIMEDGVRCTNHATEVDHLRAGDDHSMANLFPICSPHHASKSGREGWEAYRKKLAIARWKAEKEFGLHEEHPTRNPETTFKHPWQS